MKVEVKDSVVTVTMYDEYGEYVSDVTCDDSDLDSVIRVAKKAIIHAGENMKTSWPKYNSLYYTPHKEDADIAAKMDDAIKEQEEYYGVNAYCMSRTQLLTVAAKLIGVTDT